MKSKVAAMMKFKNDELKDIASFLHQNNNKITKSYNDVLELTLEQYLGRKFQPQTDFHRIYANVHEGTNQTDYYMDDKLIGSLSTRFNYDGDDFAQDKVSFIIQFTPYI